MGANSTTEPTVTTAATATGANETSMPSKEAVNVVHDLAAPATKASAPVTEGATESTKTPKDDVIMNDADEKAAEKENDSKTAESMDSSEPTATGAGEGEGATAEKADEKDEKDEKADETADEKAGEKADEEPAAAEAEKRSIGATDDAEEPASKRPSPPKENSASEEASNENKEEKLASNEGKDEKLVTPESKKKK